MIAIFRSTSQALHFAYLVQSFEASPESQLAKEIRKHMKMLGESDHRSTVDFGGLNPLEIRAQCAMIRGAVDSKLAKHEADAIKARYGLVASIKSPDGERRMEIGEERREAIIGLSDYLHPQFDSIPRKALCWLVSRAVGNVAAMRPSYRVIEEQCGGSRSEFSRIAPKLTARISGIEGTAIDKLTPLFEGGGLVESGG